MSTLLKTTSKAASNAKGKSRSKLPRSDVQAAADDMALEAGIAMSGEEDSEDDAQDFEMSEVEEEEEIERPAKKSKKAEKGKGKEEKKKTVSADMKDQVTQATVTQRRKDKVLMLSSRGTTQRMRHLMLDLETILPHIKKG
jgi:hypothetical protein